MHPRACQRVLVVLRVGLALRAESQLRKLS